MRVELYQKLQQLLLTGENPRLESSLEPDSLGRERLSWTGGSCGEVPRGQNFDQILSAPVHLVICGGGHVSQALAPAAQAVGFEVTVLENRPEVLSEGNFPSGTDLRCGEFDQLLQQGQFGTNTFYAIMTRGHREDWTCLSRILKLPHSYVGMMGSRKKVAATRQRLEQEGFSQALIGSVHSPIGLAIGAETPAEIAVSVVAELIQCRQALGLQAPLEPDFIRGLDQFPYAMVTLVDCQGSTPRSPGARMLVFEDGSIRGTIGGGVSEADATQRALESLKTGKPGLFTYRMDGSADSICGGTVQYLIIPVKEDDFTC